MITVINNFNESVEMYEGMSLADASAQFMLEANQLINDFTMDLLMTEHTYLAETGKILDWTHEAEGGIKIKEKIEELVKNAKMLFLKIVNNVIAFVQEKTSEVISQFGKIGLTKNNIKRAFEGQKDKEVETVPAVANYKDFLTAVKDGYTAAFINDDDLSNGKVTVYDKAGVFFKNFEDKFVSLKVKAGDNNLVDNVIDVIYNSKGLIKSAKDAYNEANKKLDELKKSHLTSTELNAEEIKTAVDDVKKCILSNTYVMRDLTKVYTLLIKNGISVARKLANSQIKADVKAKAGEVKEKADEAKDKVKEKIDATKQKIDDNKKASKAKFLKTKEELTKGAKGLVDKVKSAIAKKKAGEDDELKGTVAQESAIVEYIQACLEGTCEVDVELLDECVEFIKNGAPEPESVNNSLFLK